jgi:surface polysaccharide O-acyltransferase-like enzyme
MRIRSSILYTFLILGFTWTIFGTYVLVGSIGERFSQFFYDAFSVNVIVASVALFLLLAAVPSNGIENRFPRANRVIHQISQNTLPIYLLHVMVLESLQRGYFGFQISITTMNPVIEIPLITAITLSVCLVLIYLLKKAPFLRRAIG